MANLASNVLTAAIFGLAAVGIHSEVQAKHKDINCLAQNIYHEARGEPVEGRIAVAHVTMNRVQHSYFPDNICSVVWQKGQFSWTNDGRSDKTRDKDAWISALDVADLVYSAQVEDPSNGSLFYHATHIKGTMFKTNFDHEVTIGNHRFYTWDGVWK